MRINPLQLFAVTVAYWAASCSSTQPNPADGAVIDAANKPGDALPGDAYLYVDPDLTTQNTTKPSPNKVDILFVIDNSDSMDQEQKNLRTNFPRLIDALQLNKNQQMDVHIGITSTDLGAGKYTSILTCEQPNGDGGKLINKSTVKPVACATPTAGYIKYANGKTNIINAVTTDPIDQIKEAFKCIAALGTGGCAFEAQLEAARLALDPKDNVNPGFLRPEALLAVVWITDEDDCSARDTTLFDPGSTTYGPLSSFRCTSVGVECAGTTDISKAGKYQSCQPSQASNYDVLYQVSRYVDFFKMIKPAGRVVLAAIAGPTEPFEVKINQQDNESRPELAPSCISPTSGKAVPAVRIKAVMDADPTLKDNSVLFPICEADYGPAMDTLAKKITANLGS